MTKGGLPMTIQRFAMTDKRLAMVGKGAAMTIVGLSMILNDYEGLAMTQELRW